jgi:hypothetical protein
MSTPARDWAQEEAEEQECISCGTCVPWRCAKCGQMACTWFETDFARHIGCPAAVRSLLPAAAEGE